MEKYDIVQKFHLYIKKNEINKIYIDLLTTNFWPAPHFECIFDRIQTPTDVPIPTKIPVDFQHPDLWMLQQFFSTETIFRPGRPVYNYPVLV